MPTQTVFLKSTNLPEVILVTIALSVSMQFKFYSGGFLSGGVLSWGVFVRGVFVEGLCLGGFCPGGFCPRTAKNYVVCRNTAKVVKLKVHVLQLLNV